VNSQVSGSRTGSQRGAAKGRKGAKSRASMSERSASKTRPVKEEYKPSTQKDSNITQPPKIAQPPNAPRIAASQPSFSAQKIEQLNEIAKRDVSGYPPQNGPRQITQRPPGPAMVMKPSQIPQRMPTHIPPQITAADVSRAHANMPLETELIVAKIAGENVKASAKTVDYLRRFETFLNKPPGEKLQFLNEKYFKSIPRDTGVFKTNRGKEVKCPVCMKTLLTVQAMEVHFQKAHKELVQLGLEFSNGEYKVSNKIANVVAMFCFTYNSTIPGVVTIAKDRLNGREPKFFDLDKDYEEDA
jgi:hypothetical protein